MTGVLGYSIYEMRHPVDQYEPDPEKKTLVILGTFAPLLAIVTLTA